MMRRVSPLSAIGLLVIGGVNVWLLTVIVAAIAVGDVANLDKVEWNANLSASIEHAANRKPIDAYKQILARPIFFKSRAPYVAPPPPPPPAPKVAPSPPVVTDPGLVLGGVMIKNDVKKAYVFSKTNAEGAWASEGQDFMGWKIRSVDGAGAKLEQQGRTIELQLYPQK